MIACQNGHTETAPLLIQNGVHVNMHESEMVFFDDSKS